MPAHQNLVGQRFNRLLIVERVKICKEPGYKWRCRCDCGGETIARVNALKSGGTKSCGCHRRETSTKHGYAGSQTYRSWSQMKARCSTETTFAYEIYGGRGITYCARWERFENFLADMGEKPPNKTLDRIDCNGNYTPENCRWATNTEQQRNKRNSANITVDGVTRCVAEWAEVLRVNYKTIYRPFRRGADMGRLIRKKLAEPLPPNFQLPMKRK